MAVYVQQGKNKLRSYSAFLCVGAKQRAEIRLGYKKNPNPRKFLKDIRQRPKPAFHVGRGGPGAPGAPGENGEKKGSTSRRSWNRERPVIGKFQLADLNSVAWTMHCLGTALDQAHLRHKELIYLFRRRRAYRSLRNDIWRASSALLKKIAAARKWGDVPPPLLKALSQGPEGRMPVAEVRALWPAPFLEFEEEWDEIYLKEFPEVVDKPLYKTDKWVSFLTPFSRSFLARPSLFVQQVMQWRPILAYKKIEFPVKDPLSAVDEAIKVLGEVPTREPSLSRPLTLNRRRLSGPSKPEKRLPSPDNKAKEARPQTGEKEDREKRMRFKGRADRYLELSMAACQADWLAKIVKVTENAVKVKKLSLQQSMQLHRQAKKEWKEALKTRQQLETQMGLNLQEETDEETGSSSKASSPSRRGSWGRESKPAATRMVIDLEEDGSDTSTRSDLSFSSRQLSRELTEDAEDEGFPIAICSMVRETCNSQLSKTHRRNPLPRSRCTDTALPLEEDEEAVHGESSEEDFPLSAVSGQAMGPAFSLSSLSCLASGSWQQESTMEFSGDREDEGKRLRIGGEETDGTSVNRSAREAKRSRAERVESPS